MDDASDAVRRAIDVACGKLAATVTPSQRGSIRRALRRLARDGQAPPRRGRGFNWDRLAEVCGVGADVIETSRYDLTPALKLLVSSAAPPVEGQPKRSAHARPCETAPPARRRGRRPAPYVEFPEASPEPWEDPAHFRDALALHMRRHNDSTWRLHAALTHQGADLYCSTIISWRSGRRSPQDVKSFEILELVERRYRLEPGYFRGKLANAPHAVRGEPVLGLTSVEMRRLAWHLPDDFRRRPLAEQREIVDWVQTVIVSGATDYRRYQAEAMKHRFGLQLHPRLAGAHGERNPLQSAEATRKLLKRPLAAPPQLREETAQLLAFKTSTLTPVGYERAGVWGAETADQKVEHIGLLFGAMSASADGPVQGLGAPREALTFALLALPEVWDWYVQWREKRRGFYTAWEVDLLRIGASFLRDRVGWIRQTPALAERLTPIDGLVSEARISAARADWGAACELGYRHNLARAKEIERVARVHRDPFEPILPILEAESPLAEYRKITEEILQRLPDPRCHPRPHAEAIRAFLMLRIGLHTGLRQKNLRQLMACGRHDRPRSDRQLAEARRGELRYNIREGGWEVYVPAIAFKNAHSSFFGARPFRLVLPDLGGLYGHIERYLEHHRARLLGGAADPGTFFVKTAKATSRNAAYDQTTFYEAWRFAIQRYGIFNPYTGRGAIRGLLPHGPHNVRDVLATHILKQTGSFEQASYAIQDTPDMVAEHYGRFLPQDMAALAAQVLNQVWA